MAVLLYVRYPLSLRNVENLLAECGIDISYEAVRLWWNRFGPLFAAEIRKRRVNARRGSPEWRRHLDEVFVKINGITHYLWRAVDHEGEVLEAVATKQRDTGAAIQCLRLSRRHIFRGQRINNRAENSHQPFRRRERAMLRFRRLRTLQKFTAIHGAVHNHFNLHRHLPAAGPTRSTEQ